MTVLAGVRPAAARASRGERAHRLRLAAGYALAIATLAALAIYGAPYYALPPSERPFSPRHALLRPSGVIGLKLGFAALAMFLAIFLYPLRKRIGWLARRGSSRHWLDVHVLLGLTAPLVTAFHASFKFRGLAGMAFFIMAAVAASGVVGRYLYGQIPRRLAAAELSLREIQEVQARAAAALRGVGLISERELEALLRLPSPEQVRRLSAASALAAMVALDAARAWRVARLRRRASTFGARLRSLFGLLPTAHADLESAVAVARREAAAAKQVVFLARAQQVFRLWHVVHRPFSYSFAVLAAAHVTVVWMMGFF